MAAGLSLAPLVIPLGGLVRGRRHTFAWCSLLAIPYMALGVTELISDPRRARFPPRCFCSPSPGSSR